MFASLFRYEDQWCIFDSAIKNSINKKQMLEKTLRWSSVSEIQGGIQGGRFEDVEMEIGPVDIYRHISFTNTYLPFPCDTGMVEQTVLPI